MIGRLWSAVRNIAHTGPGRESAIDACLECGSSSLPGSGRCIDCLED